MSGASPDSERARRRPSKTADSQVVRALALLMEMSRSQRGVLLKAFSEARGYSLRSVYRARDALAKAGAPLRVNPDNPGRWQLTEGWLPASVVGPARAELAALFVARHLAPGLNGTSVARSLDSLWSKLVSAKPQQSMSFSDPGGMLSVRSLAPLDYGAHRATLEQLTSAIGAGHAVWIRYRKPDGTVSDRIVEPGFLHWDGGLEAMYVPSWCRLRGAVRVFAVHRILAVEALPDDPARSVPRRQILERAFRIWHREQIEHVEVWFAPAVAGEIRERRWHATQRLVSDGADGVSLHLDVAAPEELERWLIGFGADVRVREPKSLVDRVREAHVRAANLGQVVVASTPSRRAGTQSVAPAGAVRAKRSRGRL
jgi:predicted DNA-binding transcriptional regulator YafY